MECSFEGSPLLEEASVSLRIPSCIGFMWWWYDEKGVQNFNMVEVLSIKEVVEGSLDNPKENEACMLVFDFVESCHKLTGKCFISRAW